jgi:hypothetical protein
VEELLYKSFWHRRVILGLPTDDVWLKMEFKRLLALVKPVSAGPSKKPWHEAKQSNGWLAGFKKRFPISSQYRTEKKPIGFAGRRASIYAFHLAIWWIQNRVFNRRDPVYGAFGPCDIYHMDQIPLPFCLTPKRSLNPVGMYCWIRDVPMSGLDKRQSTIQVTIRAEGPQDVDCVLIVNGSGLEVPEDELAFYATLPHVRVVFQKNAWCDKGIMRWWYNKCWKDKTGTRSRLLVLDNLSTHVSSGISKSFVKNRTFVLNPPPNTTDLTCPIDHHVGAWLKDRMRVRWVKALEDNWQLWRDPQAIADGALSASNRRMMMAQWLSDAWEELQLPENNHVIRDSFERTGILIKSDMTHNIKMRGGDTYKFP